MDFILIYITNPTDKEAKETAKYLLKKKLIACANIFPINSLYRWKGKIADRNEIVLIGKTTENKFEIVKNEIEKIHSYKIPCIVKIPVSSNKKYYDWLKKEIE